VRALLAALLLALPASAEPIGWVVPVDEPLDSFVLCSDSSECVSIGYSRWVAPRHPLGPMHVYRAEVELEPGVRAWVEGRTPDGAVVPADLSRIWCSPWDFTGDGEIGARDFATYLGRRVRGLDAGGAREFANLLRVFAEACR